MKKLFLVLLIVTVMVSLGFTQQKVYNFESLIINGYTIATDEGAAAVNVPGFKNAYSVALDPDGKIWTGSYYSRVDEFTKEYPDLILKIVEKDTGTGPYQDTTEYYIKPIFTWDPATQTADTISFLNLPDGSIDTLTAGHRGMGTDPDGNIIASFANGAVYKINYQTHDVIAKYETGGSNGRPGVDAEGYVYQMDGVFATRIDILDPDDWSSPFNQITGISAGVTRCMEVSPDGQNVYVCSQSGGIHHYYSADGVYGTYALVDTILASVQIDDTTEVPFATNLAQWSPDGLLLVASYDDVNFRAIYALDPDQDYRIVSLEREPAATSIPNMQFWNNTDLQDTTSGNYPKPQYLRCVRDAAFDATTGSLYLAEFYGYGVKKFDLNPNGINGIAPGQDKKEVAGTFTLYRNYPNPFNPTTTIPFELRKSADVVLRVYDVRGSLVGTYINKRLEAGRHEFKFNGSNLASGQYYFKLTVDHAVATGKMMLVK
ncbi:MAG: T9SS type A sorting domain-containing protein [Calditrichia bacterium]